MSAIPVLQSWKQEYQKFRSFSATQLIQGQLGIREMLFEKMDLALFSAGQGSAVRLFLFLTILTT